MPATPVEGSMADEIQDYIHAESKNFYAKTRWCAKGCIACVGISTWSDLVRLSLTMGIYQILSS